MIKVCTNDDPKNDWANDPAGYFKKESNALVPPRCVILNWLLVIKRVLHRAIIMDLLQNAISTIITEFWQQIHYKFLQMRRQAMFSTRKSLRAFSVVWLATDEIGMSLRWATREATYVTYMG